MFHRILVPTDLSPGTAQAMALAHTLRAPEGEIILLHVMSDVTPETASFAPDPAAYDASVAVAHREEVAEVGSFLQRFAGTHVRSELRWGPRVETILETATRLHADLIVMPTVVRHGLSRVWGRVAEPVMRLAPCAVLLWRSED